MNRVTVLTVGWAVLASFAAGLPANTEVPAAPVSNIRLKATSGKTVRALAPDGRLATLLVFAAPECPISNAYAREVGRICAAVGRRGVKTYLVYSDQAVSLAAARKHRRDFGYPCQGLLDPNRKLARAAGATKTPEAALIGRDGKLIYRGRIDDTWVAYGDRRHEPTSRDLRRAIDSYLAGKPVKPDRTPVVGCYIPD